MMQGNKDSIKKLLNYLSPYKFHFIFALLCMVVFGASDGIIPFLVKDVLDKAFAGSNPNYIYLFPIVLIVVSVIRAIADFGQQFLMSSIGHYLVRDIRNQMNRHFLKLNPDFFLYHSSADLIARMTSDVMLVRSLLTESLASVIRDSIRIIVLIITALYLDPILALIAFVAFPLGAYPVQVFGKKMRKLSRRGQEAIGTMSSMLQESILGNRVVKIFGAEEFEDSRFIEHNKNLTKTFISSEKIRALIGPINEVLASFAVAGVIFYGANSVLKGQRTQGEFIAFLLAVFLMYDPFKKITRVSGSVYQGLAGAQRIFDILESKPKIVNPENPQKLNDDHTITITDVSFAYPNTDSAALKNITLEIKDGKKTAIVGSSGSGKSTLIDLIPRFIGQDQGSIKIGGIDSRDLDLADLRSVMATVSQHTFLFNDTIYNNILYGKLDASAAEIEKAAENAFAMDFIKKLPNGMQTIIGEGGFALSGGERQRISIARAILKDAPILILDEATASLDNQSEMEIQKALERLEKNRTTIVIAHRLSTIKNADVIVVFKGGFLVESGTHEQLVYAKGEYFRLLSIAG